MLSNAWTYSVQDALAHYGVTEDRGLDESRARENAKLYGRNVLPEEPATSMFKLILAQFEDQLVLILLGSAIVSFILACFEDHTEEGGWVTAFVEPLVILLILIANAAVGVIQESNAEQAIDALKEYSPDEATVIRSGRSYKIHSSELVPGDIVQVHVGDKIPADCRVLSFSSSSFRVDQALLTGESMSVSKMEDKVADEKAVRQDMMNMLFAGTTVVNGAGKALVVLTGPHTAIGQIHESISSTVTEKTPLKRKLDDFGDSLAKVISVICILVWLVNIRHFNDPAHHGWLKGAIYYLKIAVALAVAAIPEGLAAVITACLALGTKKMAKRGAIVRNLPSVETLGCTNVICSDKTGTLTTNQMSVSRFLTIENGSTPLREYRVTGSTFAPVGEISASDAKFSEKGIARTRPIERLMEISAICNDARIAYNDETRIYTNLGEPTEAALKVLVEKAGTNDENFNKTLGNMHPSARVNAVNSYYEQRIPRLLTFEFSRDRKSMSVLAKHERHTVLFVKGAPESVIERCSTVLTPEGTRELTSDVREQLARAQLEYGKSGLRTLAFAFVDEADSNVDHYKTESAAEYVNFEQNMTFVGLVGMLDPPRPEVRDAIAKCRAAGIRTIVITGDNKNTAETICREIGIFGMNEDLTGKSYTGRELDDLSPGQKILAVQRASLFSRTEPNHKSQLVDLLQGQGLVVAMTGDGVNDAGALKKADIGIAMGSGTDVAKLAADMVLATDNFATIEKAVEEGRAIYNNTKQFIRYLISSNIGEVVSIFLTVLLGMPEALIPVQLLWVNLVTDGLPATALGFNPPDNMIMRTPPRSGREPLVGPWLFVRYMVIGIYVGCATVFGYAWWFIYYSGGPQITFHQLTHFHQCSTKFPEIGCEMFSNDLSKTATTMSLSILVVIEMLNACNSLSENESLLVMPIWVNPYLVASIALSMALHFMILYVPFLSSIFQIIPLNWDEWMAVLWISAPIILIDEVLKYLTLNVIDPPLKAKVD